MYWLFQDTDSYLKLSYSICQNICKEKVNLSTFISYKICLEFNITEHCKTVAVAELFLKEEITKNSYIQEGRKLKLITMKKIHCCYHTQDLKIPKFPVP
jgi:hypothetical protein